MWAVLFEKRLMSLKTEATAGSGVEVEAFDLRKNIITEGIIVTEGNQKAI